MSTQNAKLGNFSSLLSTTSRYFMLRNKDEEFHYDRIVESNAQRSLAEYHPMEILQSIRLENWKVVKAFYIVLTDINADENISVKDGVILDNTNNATILCTYTEEMLLLQHQINKDLPNSVQLFAACNTICPILFSAANKKIIYYIEKKRNTLQEVVSLSRKYALVNVKTLYRHMITYNLSIIYKQARFDYFKIESKNEVISLPAYDLMAGYLISIKKTDLPMELFKYMQITAIIYHQNKLSNQISTIKHTLKESSLDPDMHMYDLDDYYLYKIDLCADVLKYFKHVDVNGVDVSVESCINVCFNISDTAEIQHFPIKLISIYQKKLLYCDHVPTSIQESPTMVLNRNQPSTTELPLLDLIQQWSTRVVRDIPHQPSGGNNGNSFSMSFDFPVINSENNEGVARTIESPVISPENAISTRASSPSSTISDDDSDDDSIRSRRMPTSESSRAPITPVRSNSPASRLEQTTETPVQDTEAANEMPPEIRSIFNIIFNGGNQDMFTTPPRRTTPNQEQRNTQPMIFPVNLFGSGSPSEQNIDTQSPDMLRYLNLHSKSIIALIKQYEKKFPVKSSDIVECVVELRTIKVGELYYKCDDGCGKCICESACDSWFYKSNKNTCPNCRHEYKNTLPPLFLRITNAKRPMRIKNHLSKKLKCIKK